MRLVVFALVLSFACGKKKEEREAPPATAPAPHPDAGLRPSTDMLDRAPFVIQLSFAQVDRGKQTRSVVVHATVIGDRLFYKSSGQGPPLQINSAPLTPAEVTALRQSIADKNLLAEKSIQGIDDSTGPGRSMRADFKVRIDDARNGISLTGALDAGGKATALAATDAYRGLAAFAAELHLLAASKKTKPN